MSLPLSVGAFTANDAKHALSRLSTTFSAVTKTLWRRNTGGGELHIPEGSDRSIDARSIVTLIVFFAVNALVIWPIRIPLPLFITSLLDWLFSRPLSPSSETSSNTSTSAQKLRPTRRRTYFKLGLETAPVVGVLLLLASTCIPGKVLADGIVGSEGVRPYDIMTLFISFAYISISLDCTGVLQYLAHLVGTKAGSSGSFLYFAFYCFFSLTGLLIGNDPLILSGTPFLVYFTRHAAIQPENQTSYLFTHFQSSNLVSALLVSSNPTNLVLTSAFGISFLQYSAWLALPTLAAMVVLFPLLRWGVFRSRIPRTLNPPKVNPKDSLIDPWGGIFGTVLFILVIILLVSLSAVGLLEGVQGVWSITAPAGIIMFVRDCWHDLHVGKRDREEAQRKQGLVAVQEEREMTAVGKRAVNGSDDGAAALSDKDTTLRANGIDRATSAVSAELKSSQVPSGDGEGSTPHAATTTITPPSSTPEPRTNAEHPPPAPPVTIPHKSPLLAPVRLFARLFPTPALIITRLPLPLVPFAFAMFILVEALSYTGWIRVFAGWWRAWVDVSGVAGAIWLMGMVSVLGCNVFGTNIGATVLLARILQFWRASSQGSVSDRTLFGAVFTLAVGSNFGAYSFVFSASLAGLLWRNILDQKGLFVTPREFIKWNTIPVIITVFVGCLVVAGEVCVMFDS